MIIYINETRKYQSYVQTVGMELTDDLRFVTQLAIHDFMNEQKIQLAIHSFMTRQKQIFRCLPNKKC